MAHVVDSERAERTSLEDRLVEKWHFTVDQALQNAKGAELTATDPERQKGKILTADQFMAKLRKLNRDIVMEPHPNAHKGVVRLGDGTIVNLSHTGLLYLVVGDQKVYLFPCESDWMAEWDVLAKTTVLVPQENVKTTAWQKVTRTHREVRRGWRQVLIRLIKQNLIGLEATEREFGPGDRASWAALTGKQKVALSY